MTDSDSQFEELRSALAHLNDPASLEAHTLAEQVASAKSAHDLTPGQLLRRTLRLAIESLDPGPQVTPGSVEARPYHVLRRRYVAGEPIQSIAAELDISERQAYRELRRGLEAVSGMLAAYLSDAESTAFCQDEPTPGSGVRAEIARLSSASPQIVDLNSLLDYAVSCAQPLALERGLEVQWDARGATLFVATQRIMLRQAILNLLSATLHAGTAVSPVVQAWQTEAWSR